MQYDGVAVLLGSIRTFKSQGIGSYLDLIPLIDLMKLIGFNIIQLLPIQDSDLDPSPYNALSNVAFHPIYIDIEPHLMTSVEKEKFQKLSMMGVIAYQEVLLLKLAILKRAYQALSNTDRKNLEMFLEQFKVLKPYAVYKVLKESNSALNPDSINHYFESHQDECYFHIFLQKICHDQMTQVRLYSKKNGIVLMCDLPILLSPKSVEVWQYPNFFNTDFVAGTPPDAFSKEGQYWGFPLYDWEAIEHSGFLLWKDRFSIMDHFFDIFRIDHILGFFRFYAILKNQSPKFGQYIPKDEKVALEKGQFYLQSLLNLTHMRAIGEDLGTKIEGMGTILETLKIAQTKIIRWEKKHHQFIPLNHYPKLSIVSLSNHDIELFAAWWKFHPKEQKAFAHLFKLEMPTTFDCNFILTVLRNFHKIDCVYRINLIQEYLALNLDYVSENPEDDRINIPGKVSLKNWNYRMKPHLETLINDSTWIEAMQSLIKYPCD